MGSPRVTVFTPVRDGARFLDETIDSVLAQSFRDFEYVLVDDASTDETPQILERRAAADSRIVVMTNAQALGAGGAGNVAIRAARGVYLARQDADDIAMPGRLEAEVAALDADSSLAAVSMNYEFVDQHGTVLHEERRDLPPEIVGYLTLFTNALGGASQVMFRREAVLAAGGYDQSFAPSEDAELYTRLLAHGRIAVLPQVGMRYRLHGGQITKRDVTQDADRRALAIGRRLYPAHFGRDVTEAEILALAAAWRGWARHVDVTAAARLIRESYHRFALGHPQSGLLATLRRVIAARLAATALLVFRAGLRREALAYFTAALRWNPAAALREPVRLAAQTFVSRRRRRASASRHRG